MILLVVLLAISLDIFVFSIRAVKERIFLGHFHTILTIALTTFGIILSQFYEPLTVQTSLIHADIASLLMIYGIMAFGLNIFIHPSLNLFSIFIKILTLISVCFSNILVQLGVINLILLYGLIFMRPKYKGLKLIVEMLLVLSWLFIPIEFTGQFWEKYSIWPLLGVNCLYIFINESMENRIHHAFLSIPLFVANFQILSNWDVQNSIAAIILVFIGLVQALTRGPVEYLKKQFPFSLVALLFSSLLSGFYMVSTKYSIQFFLLLFSILLLKGYFRLSNREKSFTEIVTNQILQLIFLIAPGFPLYIIFYNMIGIPQIWLRLIGPIWNIFLCTIFVIKIYFGFANYKEKQINLKSMFVFFSGVVTLWAFWIFNLEQQYNIHSGQIMIHQIGWNVNDFIISLLSIILGVVIGFLFCSRKEWKLLWEKMCLKIIAWDSSFKEKFYLKKEMVDLKVVSKKKYSFTISSDEFVDLLTDQLKIVLAAFFLFMFFILTGLFL